MKNPTPLPPAIEAAYLALQAEMKTARAAGDKDAFVRPLLKAWDLIPEPKLEYDRAQSIVGAIVRHHRDSGSPGEALKWLPVLRASYGGGPDPHVDFTTGTVFLAAGRIDEAFASFDAVHARFGRRPFQGEDPKYLQFYLQRKTGAPPAIEVKAGPSRHEPAEPVRTPAELPDEVATRVESLCAEGDELAEAGRHDTALARYRAAWDLLPSPRTDWEAATWILAAIGDVQFAIGDFVACRDAMSQAMMCPGGLGNPFLRLRLGQAHYELADLDRAADELIRAYMGAGSEIFEDGEKYFEFLKTRALPPLSGW